MALPVGLAAERLHARAGLGPLSPREAELLEWLHPESEVTTWRGEQEWRTPLACRRRARKAPNWLYSIFVKSPRAGLKRRQSIPYWNSIDPSTGEFRVQQSMRREFQAYENACLRAAVRVCSADPDARVLLIVYDGKTAGRRVYYCFAARLLQEDSGIFVGQIVAPTGQVPWVCSERMRRAAAAAATAGSASAAAANLARPPPTPQQ